MMAKSPMMRIFTSCACRFLIATGFAVSAATAQLLIGGAIGIGFTQIPSCVDYGLPLLARCSTRSCPSARYTATTTIADIPAVPIARTFIVLRDSLAWSLYVGHSYVQQGIELGPNLIFLGAGHMAKRAFLLRSHFGSWSFWLMMIEIVVPPSAGIGIALGILDGRIAAIERSGEIAPPRRFGSRTVGVLPRQRELQLLEQDCPFGKCKRLLVYLV